MIPDEISPLSPSDSGPDPEGSNRDQTNLQDVPSPSASRITASLQNSSQSFSKPSPDSALQADIQRLVQASLSDLEQRKRMLQREIDQLERRKERIEAEMRTSFAGASQDLAIRIQGFKEYLVGSLQDLADAAEQLELLPPDTSRPEPPTQTTAAHPPEPESVTATAFAVQRFEEQRERVRSLIDQYRTRPDYYGPPWQLRRTFEPIHADRVSNWFFTQGGRGAVKTMGSRLQNVLVASAAISILYTIYGNRLCNLVLANTPERLGEWRRWLQDCLGISRTDFGTNQGLMLFEAPEPMAQRAERLLENGRLPMIVIDAAEDKVPLALLQFPLWLAFAPDPANPPVEDYYY
jgi:hypothetical protein